MGQHQPYSPKAYLEALGEQAKGRHQILLNPEVDFQTMSINWAFLKGLRAASIRSESSVGLEVGCGNGGFLLQLLQWGFSPQNLYGVDVLEDRISDAKLRNSLVNFQYQDAQRLSFQDGYFDFVFCNGLFIQMIDRHLRTRVAEEMLRVLKPGGHVLVSDWKWSRPGNTNYLGLNRADIRRMFGDGERSFLQTSIAGALAPPVGRFLSKSLPSTYFLWAKIFPFLVAHEVTVLRKA